MTTARALALLELELQIKASGYADAVEQLEAWKAGPLKKAFKRKALELHSDRGGDATPGQFTEIKGARDHLLGLKVRPPGQRRRARPQPTLTEAQLNSLLRAVFGGGMVSRAATASSSTTSSSTSQVRVRRARPRWPSGSTTPSSDGE